VGRIVRDAAGTSAAPRELPLLLGASKSAPESLMLIGVPGADDVLHIRIWTAEDWSAPPRVRAERAGSFLAWLEAQSAAGRSMNQSMYGLRLWLRGTDPAEPAR
jgi:hypothetical protein